MDAPTSAPDRRSRARIAAVTLALVAGNWAWYVATTQAARRDHVEAETRQVRMASQGVADRVANALGLADTLARRLAEAAAERGPAQAGKLVEGLPLEAFGVTHALIADGGGRIAWHAGKRPEHATERSVADRAWFAAHRDAPQARTRIGPPEATTGAHPPVLPVTRRIPSNGAFEGVVLVSVDPAALGSGRGASPTGRVPALAVFDRDGMQHLGGTPAAPEPAAGATRAAPDVLAAAIAQGSGVTTHDDPVRGSRVVAFREIAPYGLHVAVDAPLEPSTPDRWMTRAALVRAAIGTVFLVSAGIWLDASRRRHRRAIAELEAARAAAELTGRRRAEFVNTLSHELRTPLASIVGYADLGADPQADAATLRLHARAIAHAGRTATKLLNDVLDFAKLEAGQLRIVREAVPLDDVVAESVEMVAPMAERKRLALSVSVADDVPEHVVADGGRLRQILANLLTNAVKFTERGSVTLRVVRIGGSVRFSVEDTGPGIEEEYRSEIFERFRQGPAGHASRHGGAGIGLDLVQALCGLMGGRVWLETEVGRGATFHVEFPFETAEVAGTPAAAGA